MNNKQKQIHTIDTVFPLIFILLFGFCALALVLSGAHVYQDTTDGLEAELYYSDSGNVFAGEGAGVQQ